jgi:hypothetical protein
MAFVSWLSEGKNEHTIFESKNGDVKVANFPIATLSPVSILEDALATVSTDEDETGVLEEEGEEEVELAQEDEPDTEVISSG